MYLEHHDQAVCVGCPDRARVRLRLDPARPRCLVHRAAARLLLTRSGSVASSVPGAMASGGTFHTALGAFSRAKQMRDAMVARRKKEGRPVGRKSRAVAGKPHRDRELGLWLLGVPTIDPFVVARSGAALESYGPDFRYSHFAGLKTLRNTVGGVVAVSGIPGGGPDPAGAQLPQEQDQAGRRPLGEASREVLVHRRLRRPQRRPHRAHARVRRRPRLHRDSEDACRVGDVPGPRRQPEDVRIS